MRHVPEIKLIRTDTTLDLSQKAEKVWLYKGSFWNLYHYFGSVVDGVDQVLKNVIRIIMTKMKNKDAAKNRKN